MKRGFFIFVGLALGLSANAGLGPGLEKQCGEVLLKAGHSPMELQSQCREKKEHETEVSSDADEEQYKAPSEAQHKAESTSEGNED